MPFQLAQLKAHLRRMVIDVLQHLLRPLRREDAQISLRHTQVRAHPHHTHTHQQIPRLPRLRLKDIAQIFLNQTRNLILSCCFHFSVYYLIIYHLAIYHVQFIQLPQVLVFWS